VPFNLDAVAPSAAWKSRFRAELGGRLLVFRTMLMASEPAMYNVTEIKVRAMTSIVSTLV
jgi:hypothetical protein